VYGDDGNDVLWTRDRVEELIVHCDGGVDRVVADRSDQVSVTCERRVTRLQANRYARVAHALLRLSHRVVAVVKDRGA
jgi:hypothetical protein